MNRKLKNKVAVITGGSQYALVIHLNESNFDQAISESPVPILVAFWASWCGPCRVIRPVLDEIAKEPSLLWQVPVIPQRSPTTIGAKKILNSFIRDLVAEGYRWAKLDGPYACPTKEDLREITRNPSDLNEFHMVEGVRAYFLIQRALIEIVQQDGSTGMAQIRAGGISIDLWTYNEFLSKDPIKDAYAVIETPETSGLIPVDTSAEMGTVQGATEAAMHSRRGATDLDNSVANDRSSKAANR